MSSTPSRPCPVFLCFTIFPYPDEHGGLHGVATPTPATGAPPKFSHAAFPLTILKTVEIKERQGHGGRCETPCRLPQRAKAHDGKLYLDFIQMHAENSQINLSASSQRSE